MFETITTLTDSYKLTHWKQYPKNLKTVYSYLESRKGAVFPVTTFFGVDFILEVIQDFLKSAQSLEDPYAELEESIVKHLGAKELANIEGWKKILTHNKPEEILHICDIVKIKHVPQGMSIPTSNVLMSVESLPELKTPWLTNHLETLLTQVWFPSNVATIGTHLKILFVKSLLKTGYTLEEALGISEFMLHDFGYRGTSSLTSAAIGGLAHLVNFKGTDTTAALWTGYDMYGDCVEGYSVPATEHSVMTILAATMGEKESIRFLMKEHPNSILSVVGDSYDIARFLGYVQELEPEIEAQHKASGGKFKFVLRLDSLRNELDTPAAQCVWAYKELAKAKGKVVNRYLRLPDYFGLLWGDGLSYDDIEDILTEFQANQLAVGGLVFGMGGGLLQKHNRDTQRTAFKCSFVEFDDGSTMDIQKKPLDASKASKPGKLKLIEKEVGKFTTARIDAEETRDYADIMKDASPEPESWLTIRERAKQYVLSKV